MLWDRYENGAVVETKPRPHYINRTHNPSIDQLNAAGWFGQDYRHPTDPDTIVDSWTCIGVIDGRSVYEPATTRSRAAEAEIDLAQRVALYGVRVGILAQLLAIYGMEIPTSRAEVTATIETLLANGTATDEQRGTAPLLDSVYRGLCDDGQQDYVEAIWLAVQEAQT